MEYHPGVKHKKMKLQKREQNHFKTVQGPCQLYQHLIKISKMKNKKHITKTLVAALVLHGGRGGPGGRSGHRQADLPQDGGWNNSGEV